jgi:hypothetical protein
MSSSTAAHPPAASFSEEEEPPMPIVFSKTGKTQALGTMGGGGGRTMGTGEAGQRGSVRGPIDPENELVSRGKGEEEDGCVWLLVCVDAQLWCAYVVYLQHFNIYYAFLIF